MASEALKKPPSSLLSRALPLECPRFAVVRDKAPTAAQDSFLSFSIFGFCYIELLM